MNCARCGRHLARLEGRIGDQDYCHPDDPNLPDCYEITCHEQTWQKYAIEYPAELEDVGITPERMAQARINAMFDHLHAITGNQEDQ